MSNIFVDTSGWGNLVDCSSFIIMEQQKLNQALTNDHHFEQAGFIKLLHFDSS